MASSESQNVKTHEDPSTYESQIIEILEEMRSMPYFKNEAAASGAVHNVARHEEALSLVLERHGFKKGELPQGIKKEVAMKWLLQPELAHSIPVGTFIEQPFGTHNSPDFIIKVNDKVVLFLEAKSSKDTFPVYNSGGAKKDFIYVFCSEKTNETTIYKGESIISLEQQKLIDEHIQNAREQDKVLNDKLKEIDENHRGVKYYTRPMICQSGGVSYTNYFKHEHRSEAETRVLDWVRYLCNK